MKNLTIFLAIIILFAISLTDCKKTPEIPNITNKPELPKVTTDSVYNISNTAARCNSTVTYDGNLDITKRGVCWNTTDNPTIENSIGYTTDGSGTGSFISQLTGLTENTTYYVAAYATNEKGTAYGDVKSFKTMYGFEDPRDGQTYILVDIGNQTWFAENLNYDTANSWCYDDDLANCDNYGRLYDWSTANTACPPGWHLPSDEEWTALTDYLGGEDIAGGKMKETGTTHWYSPNTGATNSSGFTALPGGLRYSNGLFSLLGGYGRWWSSTESSGTTAWHRYLYCGYDQVGRYDTDKAYDFSVRCLKN